MCIVYLKCVLDDDCVAAGARVSNFLFVDIDSLDEGTEDFGSEFFNVNVLFRLCNEILDVFLLQINLIDFLVEFIQLNTNLRLFFLVA